MITLFGALILVAVFLLVATIQWYATIPKNLPPGLLGLPFVGSFFHLINGRTQHLLLQRYVRKYGPLFKLYMGNKLVIVLGDYETIHEALIKQGDVFSGRVQFHGLIPERLANRGIVAAEGPLWKEQRRFALSVLRDLGMGRPVLESQIKEEVDEVIKKLVDHKDKPIDPMGLLLHSICTLIYHLIFGRCSTFSNRETIVRSFLRIFERSKETKVGVLSTLVLSERVTRIMSVIPAVKEITTEVERLLSFLEKDLINAGDTYEPNSEPQSYAHAFMQMAHNGQKENFEHEQLVATAFDLFVAGTQTTSTTLCWALLFLGHHPEVQEKMHAEIRDNIGTSNLPSYADRTKLPYTEAVLMEVQRAADLVPMGVLRRTLAPIKLMGYDIPEDTAVVALLTNVLHNEDNFPDPHDFNPDRFLDNEGKVVRDPKVIPFQMGKRVCLGESLARMELFLFITGIVSRLRFRFPSDKPPPSLTPLWGFGNLPQSFEVCVEERVDATEKRLF